MKKSEKIANNIKSSVQDFADTIKDNPKKIIAWARREIRAYNELITIIEKQLCKKNKK